MSGLNVVQILGLGVIGLGFLLAYLAYRLLNKIQSQPVINRSVMRSIYSFMGFSLVLCLLGFASQAYDQRKDLDACKKELNELKASAPEISKLQETIRQLQTAQTNSAQLMELQGRLREIDSLLTSKFRYEVESQNPNPVTLRAIVMNLQDSVHSAMRVAGVEPLPER